MRSSASPASARRLNSVARAMWEMVERTDDQPGTGSATYCSAVSLRQASRTLRLAQRSYANRATISSCMRISPDVATPFRDHARRRASGRQVAHAHVVAPHLSQALGRLPEVQVLGL